MSSSANLKETYSVETKHGPFYTGGTVQWSPDGSHLFCQLPSSISVLSVEKGVVISTLAEAAANTEDEDTINSFTLSSSSNSLVSHHKSGLFKLWSWDTQKIEKLWKSIHKGPVPQIALSFNDKVMASGGSDSSVRLWDLEHNACTHNLKGPQGVVSVLKFHPDPEKDLVFAAGDDTKIYGWDVTTGNATVTLSGHFSRVTAISFHDDGEHAVSSGRDKVLILWNISKGTSLRTLPVYEALEGVFIIPTDAACKKLKKFDRNSIFAAAAGEKGVVKVYEMNTGREVYAQKDSLVQAAQEDGGLSVTHLILNKDLNSFAVVSADHNIIIHSLNDFSCKKQFVGYTDEILDIVHVGEHGNHIAVASNSCDVKLYDLSTMSCQLLKGHTDLVLALAVTAGNRNLMVSSAKDNSVRVWLMCPETYRMKCVASAVRHTASVGSVALAPAGAGFFVSVSQDQCLKLWNLPEKLEFQNITEDISINAIHTALAHGKDINCAAISPNDKLIATGSQDKTAKLWSSENLQPLGVFRGHRRGVWCVRFSPIDQVLLTTSADCTMKIWSLSELNCLKTFEGHESSVLRAEFVSRGMQLITSGADGLLKLWNIKTSECTGTFEEHDNRVWALAVSRDEKHVISGGSDSLMIVWRDVTIEKRELAMKEQEELMLEEQKLANLLKANELFAALKLALKLEKPFRVLKIIEDILKSGEGSLTDAIRDLKLKQKESLLKCAVGWNTNSRNSHAAQLVINALLNDPESSNLQTAGLSSSLEGLIPYTERHFKRVTNLLQDLHFLDYAVNYAKPHSTLPTP